MDFLNQKRIAILGIAVAAAATFTSANAAFRQPTVDAFSSRFYTYTASPGERFNVRIRGDRDTDVDLFIRNLRGREVCSGVGPTDRESCSVYSPNGGVYEIELENLGDVYNDVSFWLS